jgi:hypothetical protein
MENLCYVHFVFDFETLLFSGTTEYIHAFCLQYMKQNIRMYKHRRKEFK